MNREIRYDKGLILIVFALLGFGLLMDFSASTAVSQEIYGSPTRVFTRQLLSVFVGLLVLLVSLKIDYHYYSRREFVFGSLAIMVALLVIPLAAPVTNGAQRWINLGVTKFQPSELAKLVIIILTAYYLVKNKGKLYSFRNGLLPYLSIVGVMMLLIVVEPDLGTASTIAVVAGLLLYLGGLQYRYLMGLALITLPPLYFLVFGVPYRRNRILAFLDPLEDPYGIGYQIRQSLIAVGAGGWTGLGLAEGRQKLLFLPEPHTDFIFSVVAEELGFLGCLTLVMLFGLLFWRGVRISLRADCLFGTFLGLGISCWIVVQALVNMSVAISLLPTKGIPLPFISVGGSSMLATLAAIGVLLNISRHGQVYGSREEWLRN